MSPCREGGEEERSPGQSPPACGAPAKGSCVWFRVHLVLPAPPHRHVSACFLQRERHKLSPPRSQQINVRKVRTRREEWERRKMGIEFMSDARTLEQAGSMREDRTPGGFVVLLFDRQPQAPALLWPSGRMCSRTDHAAWSALSVTNVMALCSSTSPGPVPAGAWLASV